MKFRSLTINKKKITCAFKCLIFELFCKNRKDTTKKCIASNTRHIYFNVSRVFTAKVVLCQFEILRSVDHLAS